MEEKKECCTHPVKECCHSPFYQGYQILHIGYTVLPIIAGLDKFINGLTNWGQYLAPQFNVIGTPNDTMMAVGIIEIIAGIGVWLRPQIFAYIVAVWLLGIIVNLLMLQSFYDIALRDFGLLLGAVALARFSVCTCKKPEPSEK